VWRWALAALDDFVSALPKGYDHWAYYLPCWREAELEAQRASLNGGAALLRVQPPRPTHVLYVSEASAFSGAEQALVNLVKHIELKLTSPRHWSPTKAC
jgi:hypothetical protein